jgi:hypothetical protein
VTTAQQALASSGAQCTARANKTHEHESQSQECRQWQCAEQVQVDRHSQAQIEAQVPSALSCLLRRSVRQHDQRPPRDATPLSPMLCEAVSPAIGPHHPAARAKSAKHHTRSEAMSSALLLRWCGHSVGLQMRHTTVSSAVRSCATGGRSASSGSTSRITHEHESKFRATAPLVRQLRRPPNEIPQSPAPCAAVPPVVGPRHRAVPAESHTSTRASSELLRRW